MRCGLDSSRCFRTAPPGGVGSGSIIGTWSRRSSGGPGRGLRGGTCRLISRRIKRFGTGWTGGRRTAPSMPSSRPCRVTRTRPAIWSGWCRWTPPSPGRIQHSAGAPARFGGAPANYTLTWPEPVDHALGHSRGGWTTKAHVAVDAAGRPLAIRLTPGQAGDNPRQCCRCCATSPSRPGTGHGRVPTSWSRTRPTPPLNPKRAAPHRGSTPSSPNAATRSSYVNDAEAEADDPHGSTPPPTADATSSNALSPDSSTGAPSPPATTSTPALTAPASSSPRSSCSGYEPSDTP